MPSKPGKPEPQTEPPAQGSADGGEVLNGNDAPAKGEVSVDGGTSVDGGVSAGVNAPVEQKKSGYLDEWKNDGWVPPETPDSSRPKTADGRRVDLFEEISDWIDRNGRLPKSETDDVREEMLAHRLAGARRDPAGWLAVVGAVDRHNLLDVRENGAGDGAAGETDDGAGDGSGGGADDACPSGEESLAEWQSMGWKPAESITDLKYVRHSDDRKPADRGVGRVKCRDFDTYRHVFANAKNGLNKGIYATRDLEGKADIKVGGLFILGGLIAYVANAQNEFSKGRKRDARLRVIFQNGMESDMLKTSFMKAISADLTGRVIFEGGTGMIYVLQSLSDLPYIAERRDMIHKIGFTTGSIKSRLSTAHLNPTYLLAGVRVVANYEISNVSPRVFESLFHKFFDHVRMDIEIIDRFGEKVHPKEWFNVPIEAIADFVDKFQEHGENITRFRYDIQTARLVDKDLR